MVGLGFWQMTIVLADRHFAGGLVEEPFEEVFHYSGSGEIDLPEDSQGGICVLDEVSPLALELIIAKALDHRSEMMTNVGGGGFI